MASFSGQRVEATSSLLLQRGGALHYAIPADISEDMRDEIVKFILEKKKIDVNHSAPVSTALFFSGFMLQNG
jgi:hypothetical protein